MRGTPRCAAVRAHPIGIIPAYAGNTLVVSLTVSPSRDHPRVCGEHLTENEAHRVGEGSSPRMRGTRERLPACKGVEGIIPAYAGNTMIVPVPHIHWRDHPRVCGEHTIIIIRHRSSRGSSPRMRGTLADLPFDVLAFGIIPAYAGNTTKHGTAPVPAWDHPRVCGEHTKRL